MGRLMPGSTKALRKIQSGIIQQTSLQLVLMVPILEMSLSKTSTEMGRLTTLLCPTQAQLQRGSIRWIHGTLSGLTSALLLLASKALNENMFDWRI